jgi:hypothetical protein
MHENAAAEDSSRCLLDTRNESQDRALAAQRRAVWLPLWARARFAAHRKETAALAIVRERELSCGRAAID